MRSKEERVSDHVDMKLAEPYLKKGRNITIDNYFTSTKLANLLKSKNTSLLGTLNKVRREVSNKIKSMRNKQYATNLYKSGDMLLTVYQEKPTKNVLLLSTLHTNAAISENKKNPETVKCYNETKYGVEAVDQMARKYTVRTMTRRWPVHSFQNTLDLAPINAWVLYKEINDTQIPIRYFLHNLAEELGMPFMNRISTPDVSGTVEEADQYQQQPTRS